MKYLFAFLIPLFSFAQESDTQNLLTADTWNITYQISETGERTEENDPTTIRNNWVKFNTDGTYETPAGVNGKMIGKWTYNAETNAIHFNERGTKYRAIVEEISDMGLLLNYVDNGGFKIGLTHYIYIPKDKSNEELTEILISGKWLLVKKQIESFTDATTAENQENSWYVFNSDGTYQKSEVIGEEPVVTDGTWFLDKEFQLNLDSAANSIYTIIGDAYKLVLTSTSGDFTMIEFKKDK